MIRDPPQQPIYPTDSIYGEGQGAPLPKGEPTQYSPDLPPPGGYCEELPDGKANGIPGEYGDRHNPDGNGISINPDSLQPGYPNSPFTSPRSGLVDLGTPGPSLDPSLLEPSLVGPTLAPSLFDLSALGPTLNPALLDPNSSRPIFHQNLFDLNAPGGA